jgi:hypothetical protein
MFTYLLSYASEINSTSGELQITFKLLSLHFHQRFNLFSRAIETFQRVGLITVSGDGIITITGWNKRQFPSDNAYARVKKFREVSKKRNVSETAPDTDTDTDTEKPPKSPKGLSFSADFLTFYSEYPIHKEKAAAWKTWQKIPHRPDVQVMVEAIRQQKRSRESAPDGTFVPEWKNPATWLNKGCWEDETPVQKQVGSKEDPPGKYWDNDLRDWVDYL